LSAINLKSIALGYQFGILWHSMETVQNEEYPAFADAAHIHIAYIEEESAPGSFSLM
jgi:hypothetical protein